MKLHVAFDITDLDQALTIASKIADYADILEVGSLLIYKHGDHAVKLFKETFSHKVIFADVKIIDRGKEATTLFAHAGADWVSVMAGTSRNVIHSVCTTAHEQGKKVMLDLLDASSLGQSALEAKSMGVDALLFHKPTDEDAQLTFQDRWEMVRGNTQLPVYIAAQITRDNASELIAFNPEALVIGKAITHAEDPALEAAYFRKLIS